MLSSLRGFRPSARQSVSSGRFQCARPPNPRAHITCPALTKIANSNEIKREKKGTNSLDLAVARSLAHPLIITCTLFITQPFPPTIIRLYWNFVPYTTLLPNIFHALDELTITYNTGSLCFFFSNTTNVTKVFKA